MADSLSTTFDIKKALLVYPESLIQGKDGEHGHIMLIHIYQSYGGEFVTKESRGIAGGFEFPADAELDLGIIGQTFAIEDKFGEQFNRLLNSAKSNSATTTGVSTNKLTIAMYMPPNVKESYQTEWENTGFGAGDGLSGFIKKIGLGSGDDSLWSQMTSGIGAVMANFAKSRLMEAAPTFVGTNFRVAFNPYMTFNFKTVKPRSFTFEFQLNPKSESEALTVWNIIKALKFYAAPSARKNDPTFWNFPSQFEIEFYSIDRTTSELVKSEWLFSTKRCALSSIDINPTQLGVFAAHVNSGGVRGAPPVQIGLSLTFDELALLTQRDILAGH